MRLKYSVSDFVLLVPILVAAILTWRNLPPNSISDFTFVVLVELVLLFFSIRLLTSNVPTALKTAADQNCYRLNGTLSPHRVQLESRAKWKLKSDVLAALMIVLLTGNGLALAIHCFIIPLPTGLGALMSIRLDREAWKMEIFRKKYDRQFERAYRQRNWTSSREAARAASGLWRAWPLLIFAVIAWALAARTVLFSMYRRALAEYARGIAGRSETYTRRDLARLQAEFEYQTNEEKSVKIAHSPLPRSGFSMGESDVLADGEGIL